MDRDKLIHRAVRDMLTSLFGTPAEQEQNSDAAACILPDPNYHLQMRQPLSLPVPIVILPDGSVNRHVTQARQREMIKDLMAALESRVDPEILLIDSLSGVVTKSSPGTLDEIPDAELKDLIWPFGIPSGKKKCTIPRSERIPHMQRGRKGKKCP